MRGKDCIVIGVEKKAVPALQDDRTIRKIHMVDDHVMLAFAGLCNSLSTVRVSARILIIILLYSGLSADARVLVDQARLECQSYKLTLEDPVTIAYIARYIANTKQVCTFGCSLSIEVRSFANVFHS